MIEQEKLEVYISEYCKKLCGEPPLNTFSLNEYESQDMPQLSIEENQILTADFTEEQVYNAIMQMEKNKAPGLVGFPAGFYKQILGDHQE